MIVKVLTDIAPEFCSDDPRRFGVIAINSKVYSVPGVENAHLRLFGRRLAFVGLSLPELDNRFGGLPERVIQSPIELWGAADASCFRTKRNDFTL